MTQHRRSALLGEWRAAAELAAILAEPIYYGAGVPRGDGRAVLVLPGLFGNDLYLQPLHTWLRRIGYRPLRSALAINAGCPERLSRRVEDELERQVRSQPGPVAIIGHSRGGILGRAIAARLGEQVSHLVLLGSPVGGLLRMRRLRFGPGEDAAPASPAVVDAGARARGLLDPDCAFPECGCAFITDLRRPLSPRTRVISIYSRDDVVVSPRACPVPGALNVEVTGTHSGLVYNRAVYQELAAALAYPEDEPWPARGPGMPRTRGSK